MGTDSKIKQVVLEQIYEGYVEYLHSVEASEEQIAILTKDIAVLSIQPI
jgi:hypothetical protein